MKRLATVFMAMFITTVLCADTKMKLESLPAAVQNAVKEQTKSAALVGLSKEVEKGKTLYEVETKANGKTRDLLLDSKGTIVETEEEVDIESIPAAAKAAILKRAGTGSVTKVEKLTAGSSISYEAAVKSKAGKSSEVGVNADGSAHKE